MRPHETYRLDLEEIPCFRASPSFSSSHQHRLASVHDIRIPNSLPHLDLTRGQLGETQWLSRAAWSGLQASWNGPKGFEWPLIDKWIKDPPSPSPATLSRPRVWDAATPNHSSFMQASFDVMTRSRCEAASCGKLCHPLHLPTYVVVRSTVLLFPYYRVIRCTYTAFRSLDRCGPGILYSGLGCSCHGNADRLSPCRRRAVSCPRLFRLGYYEGFDSHLFSPMKVLGYTKWFLCGRGQDETLQLTIEVHRRCSSIAATPYKS